MLQVLRGERCAYRYRSGRGYDSKIADSSDSESAAIFAAGGPPATARESVRLAGGRTPAGDSEHCGTASGSPPPGRPARLRQAGRELQLEKYYLTT